MAQGTCILLCEASASQASGLLVYGWQAAAEAPPAADAGHARCRRKQAAAAGQAATVAGAAGGRESRGDGCLQVAAAIGTAAGASANATAARSLLGKCTLHRRQVRRQLLGGGQAPRGGLGPTRCSGAGGSSQLLRLRSARLGLGARLRALLPCGRGKVSRVGVRAVHRVDTSNPM